MNKLLPSTLLQSFTKSEPQDLTYEQTVLQSMHNLDEEYTQAISTLKAETCRDVSLETKLVKEWNALKAQNRGKQRQVEAFEIEEANLAGKLQERSDFLTEQLSVQMLQKDGDLFSQIAGLHDQIDTINQQIDQAQEELA